MLHLTWYPCCSHCNANKHARLTKHQRWVLLLKSCIVFAAGHIPGPDIRDTPGFSPVSGFGPPGGHAFMEPRGDPVPAGRGRGFAIGRGRPTQGNLLSLCLLHLLHNHAWYDADHLCGLHMHLPAVFFPPEGRSREKVLWMPHSWCVVCLCRTFSCSWR